MLRYSEVPRDEEVLDDEELAQREQQEEQAGLLGLEVQRSDEEIPGDVGAACGSLAVAAAGGEESPSSAFQRAKLLLMASYALGAWAWRSWEFAVALLLISVHPSGTLSLVSVYGLLDNLVRITMGASAGSYIER
jgi:hypothetical protein